MAKASEMDLDLDLDMDLDGNEGSGDLGLEDDLDLGSDLGTDMDLGSDLDLGGDLGGDEEEADFGSMGGDEPLDGGDDFGTDLDLGAEDDLDAGSSGNEDLTVDMSGLEDELGLDDSDLAPPSKGGAIKEVESDDELDQELASLNDDLVLDESLEVQEVEGADDAELAFEGDLGEEEDSFGSAPQTEEEEFAEPPTLPEDTLVDLSDSEMELSSNSGELLEEELETPLPDDLDMGAGFEDDLSSNFDDDLGSAAVAEDSVEEIEEIEAVEEVEDLEPVPMLDMDDNFDLGDEPEAIDEFAALEEEELPPPPKDFETHRTPAKPAKPAVPAPSFEEEEMESGFSDPEEFESEDRSEMAFEDLEEPQEFTPQIQDETNGFEIEEAPKAQRMKVDLSPEPVARPSLKVPGPSSQPAPGAEGLVGKNLLYKIPHQLKVEIGRTNLTGEDLTRLNYGSVIELDRKVGDPVDIVLGGQVIAKGEVVQINQEQLGVRVTRIDF